MEEWTILGVGGWVGNNLEKILFLQEQMEGRKLEKAALYIYLFISLFSFSGAMFHINNSRKKNRFQSVCS